jgi:hypothetical protein
MSGNNRAFPTGTSHMFSAIQIWNESSLPSLPFSARNFTQQYNSQTTLSCRLVCIASNNGNLHLQNRCFTVSLFRSRQLSQKISPRLIQVVTTDFTVSPLPYAEIGYVFVGQDYLRTRTPCSPTLNPVLSENSIILIRDDPYSSRISVYHLFKMAILKSVSPRRVESWLFHP